MPPASVPRIELPPAGAATPPTRAAARPAAGGPLPPQLLALIEAMAEADAARDFGAWANARAGGRSLLEPSGLPGPAGASHGSGPGSSHEGAEHAGDQPNG